MADSGLPTRSVTISIVRVGGVLAAFTLILSVVLLCHPSHALALDNAACESCHSDTIDVSVPPVDRDMACKSCHLSFAGSHPFHQLGANCGAACHPQWGDSLLTATPLYTDPVSGAAFATSLSKATPAEELHVIHSAARWPAGVSTPGSACASCHSAAACTACHTGAIAAGHANHSASGNATLTACAPWVGTVGYGVVGGDQSQRSSFQDANQCATTGCHDLAATQAARPRFVEDYNYATGGNPDAPTTSSDAISTTGTWRMRSNTVYSGNRMSYSNTAGSSLSATFTGGRVEIVSDMDPYRGQAQVLIDGSSAGTIDCYAPMTRVQAVVFSQDVAQGDHTIEVRPTGARNASARGSFVVIDAFNVYPVSRGSLAPACDSCHDGENARHEALHATSVSLSCGGAGCHTAPNLVSIHINAGTALDCGSCHESTDPTVTAAVAAGDMTCETCHPGQPHADFVARHTSITSSGCFGAGCHDSSKNLSTVHTLFAGTVSENPEYPTTCALCHANPAINTATSGVRCTGSCHGVSTHSNMSAGHAVTAVSVACTGCHGTDIATGHGAYADMSRCAWCHSQPANWSKNGDCIGCHSMATPHPGQAEAHQADSMGGAEIWMGLTDGDHNGMTIYEDCVRCHYSDLETQHAGQCQYCHTSGGAPSAPGGPWNASCQQGACHPTIHAPLQTTDDHFGAYWNSSASCDVCHDDGSPWPGSGDNCDACHSPDQTVPIP